MFFLQKGLAGELYINKIKKIEFWWVSVLWGNLMILGNVRSLRINVVSTLP